MTSQMSGLVANLAKDDAQDFCDEFGEVLNPAETDWDCRAWQLCDLGDFESRRDALWPLYQDQLVSYTQSIMGAKVLEKIRDVVGPQCEDASAAVLAVRQLLALLPKSGQSVEPIGDFNSKLTEPPSAKPMSMLDSLGKIDFARDLATDGEEIQCDSKTLVIYRKTGEWLSLNEVGVKITIGGVSPDGSVRLEVESANATGYSFSFGPTEEVV